MRNICANKATGLGNSPNLTSGGDHINPENNHDRNKWMFEENDVTSTLEIEKASVDKKKTE